GRTHALDRSAVNARPGAHDARRDSCLHARSRHALATHADTLLSRPALQLRRERRRDPRRQQDRGRLAGLRDLPLTQPSRSSSAGTSRITRAGFPTTTVRGSTSFVTTAPAPTNASSPISIPGQSTAPPPTRAPRR